MKPSEASVAPTVFWRHTGVLLQALSYVCRWRLSSSGLRKQPRRGVWLGRHTIYTTTKASWSSTHHWQKQRVEDTATGAADAATFSRSPEAARLAKRSFGRKLVRDIRSQEVSEKLPQG